jgi:hypothetical protein
MEPGLELELARLDGLISKAVQRLRAAYEISLDEFGGLYITDEQVDALVASRTGSAPSGEPLPRPPLEAGSCWAELARRLDLDPVERDLLLIGLAPELDRKYEPLFAYLNNDIAQKWPTSDLALRLLRDEAEPAVVLACAHRLLESDLLEPLPRDGIRRPELAQPFAAPLALARFLRGLPLPLPQGAARHEAVSAPLGPLAGIKPLLAKAPDLHLLLVGDPGAGRLEAVRALAADFAGRVVELDLATIDEKPERALAVLEWTILLGDAWPFIRGLDDLAARGAQTVQQVRRGLERLHGAVFIAVGERGVGELGTNGRTLRIDWPEPDAAARRGLWAEWLAKAGASADAVTSTALAERFRLGAAQIANAARAAALAHALEGVAGPEVPPTTLFRAAREQSGDALRRLASRIEPRFSWRDLVLPAGTRARLGDVASAIAHRGLVQDEWGMGRFSRVPEGLSVLFFGVSGTGKTMAASVIAGELGLELYRIDLSSVVSKYIGDTEKNLERVFKAARRSNAILLFDEADALFGKRSEVKDAHDRYANLEVAYLLQRMEEHDGPVILATNLARNMDQAFARRLHFAIEFPRPDPTSREQLWRQILGPPLPCAADLDLSFLAHTFELTGGEIRKTALDAAFTAAADGSIVTMERLIDASARELQRQGKLISGQERSAFLAAGAVPVRPSNGAAS